MPEVIEEQPPATLLAMIEERTVHFVCVAAYGFCSLDTAAHSLGLRGNRVADSVNREGRTHTFIPEYGLTVLPLPSCDWLGRPGPRDVRRFLRTQVDLVVRAHSILDGCRTLCVDLNGYGQHFPYEDARQIVLRAFADMPAVDRIYVVPNQLHP